MWMLVYADTMVFNHEELAFSKDQRPFGIVDSHHAPKDRISATGKTYQILIKTRDSSHMKSTMVLSFWMNDSAC